MLETICVLVILGVVGNIIDKINNLKKFKKKIEEHYSILAIKKQQKVYMDDYGIVFWDDFNKEIKHFIKNVIYENNKYKVSENDINLFYHYFQKLEKKARIESSEIILKNSSKKGIDYENLVLIELIKEGFEVRKTPTTGDQGVDLIASKNGKRCAIQCKFYSSAVGNKAVQEVIAGKGYYSCEYAVVCSNNDFTKSARQLAHNQDIILASEKNIAEKINELFSAPNEEEIKSDFEDDVKEMYIMENFIK